MISLLFGRGRVGLLVASDGRIEWPNQHADDGVRLTSSSVDVVQVCVTVLVRSVAGFAIEPRDSGPTSTGILYDHGLAKVLL